MKPVKLKPNSTEFADIPRPQARGRTCEMPGCTHTGDYRAPKDRSLQEHHWFCRDHVASYNAAWNFFSGMNPGDVEHYMHESLHGLRPTRPFSDWSKTEEELEEAIKAFRWGRASNAGQAHETRSKSRRKDADTPQREALRTMGLEETLDFEVIKTRYKQLAKQLHPDLNPGNAEAEERLKQINMAYTILRVAFAQGGGA